MDANCATYCIIYIIICIEFEDQSDQSTENTEVISKLVTKKMRLLCFSLNKLYIIDFLILFRVRRWQWPFGSWRPSNVQIWSAWSNPGLCPRSQRDLCFLPAESSSAALPPPSGTPLDILLCVNLRDVVFPVTYHGCNGGQRVIQLSNRFSIIVGFACFLLLRAQTALSVDMWSRWSQSRKCEVILWVRPVSLCLLTIYGWPRRAEMAHYVSGKRLRW